MACRQYAASLICARRGFDASSRNSDEGSSGLDQVMVDAGFAGALLVGVLSPA